MDEPIQTNQAAVYKISCSNCKKQVDFGTTIDDVDPDGLIVGWDGKLKNRPVSFCSEECRNHYITNRRAV